MHFTSFALVWTDEAGRPKTDAAEARAKTGPDVSGVDRRKYMPVGTSLPKRLYIRSHRHTFTDHPSATSHGGDMPCLKNGWKVAEVGELHFPHNVGTKNRTLVCVERGVSSATLTKEPCD